MILQIRWIMVALAIIALFVAWRRGQLRSAVLAFFVGMVWGIVLDLILGQFLLGLWHYGDNTTPSLFYYGIIVPCWGAFGMFINVMWDWIEDWRIALVVLIVSLFLLLEVPNLTTHSWTYSVPLWFVAIGWIPLVATHRFLYWRATLFLFNGDWKED